jgi:hypothetical protein
LKAPRNFLLPCFGNIVLKGRIAAFFFWKHGPFYFGCGTIRAIT